MRTLIATVVVSSALAACGGGGEDATTPAATTTATAETPTPTATGSGTDDTATAAGVADKYVGTWVTCVTVGPISYKITMTGSKTSATSIDYTYSEMLHSNSNCAGTGTPYNSEAGTIVYRGTKTVGTDEVDKGEATVTTENGATLATPRRELDISLVVGDTIYYGDRNAAALDAEGYPSALFRRSGFVKQ